MCRSNRRLNQRYKQKEEEGLNQKETKFEEWRRRRRNKKMLN